MLYSESLYNIQPSVSRLDSTNLYYVHTSNNEQLSNSAPAHGSYLSF